MTVYNKAGTFASPALLTGKKQNWELRLRDGVGGVNIWSFTSSGGPTARDDTLGTPRQILDLEFLANANQTPSGDDTYHGQVTSVMLYSETGDITPTSIGQDIAAKCTELSTDQSQIGSNTFVLEPFITAGAGWETMASILARVAAYGDASYNAWAFYLLESEKAVSPNGLSVLAFAQQPALTSFDYAIRVDEENLDGPILIKKDRKSVRNWIAVHYTDYQGIERWINPDQTTTQKDTDSITTYGQRDYVMELGQISADSAWNAARRFLAQNKDPKFYVASGPITVKGWIRDASGQRIPASQIRAGKRLKIENYLTDEVATTGAGLTFIVSGTSYDDATRTCQITTGVPDSLAMFLAQMALRRGGSGIQAPTITLGIPPIPG